MEIDGERKRQRVNREVKRCNEVEKTKNGRGDTRRISSMKLFSKKKERHARDKMVVSA